MSEVCTPELTLRALPDIPVIAPGDDLAALALAGLRAAAITPAPGDVLVFASKLLSRAEGRFVDLATVTPSPTAEELAARVGNDPRLVELVLGESEAVSRAAPGVLIVRHRLGFVSANAGIDRSNALPPGAAADSGPWALLLPTAPDAAAARLRSAMTERCGVELGVVISDSMGRPFRLGTVGVAIGAAGLPALVDGRGDADLCGRTLEDTFTALADQLACAADLVAGQGGEGRGVVHLRGLRWPFPAAPGAATQPDVPGAAAAASADPDSGNDDDPGARVLVRARERDLYA
ncbi:coenzyme F420-0:L-glutamate ligase [Haliangium ochraceum]|uniref:F420-dependent oxidoreductase n=1 Tax=Haliangium ochraceum (strain DSM 14365 / JCM 11303 / SMP-2) TaxID=502025 RepID=D0LGF6_HALO1|nr:coenzyme F420-0:L-glutamate ligase [Haliangium ochraceum]ACY12702.1 F420-dependent oxidoreductase [Haliangium ochraceum DSM 14365]